MTLIEQLLARVIREAVGAGLPQDKVQERAKASVDAFNRDGYYRFKGGDCIGTDPALEAFGHDFEEFQNEVDKALEEKAKASGEPIDVAERQKVINRWYAEHKPKLKISEPQPAESQDVDVSVLPAWAGTMFGSGQAKASAGTDPGAEPPDAGSGDPAVVERDKKRSGRKNG